MSTKSTLDYGEDHHLYLEIFEPGRVYLALTRVEFVALPSSVTVAIPLDLWERLRKVEVDDSICWREDETPPGQPTVEEA